jgi:hypothetical protein
MNNTHLLIGAADDEEEAWVIGRTLDAATRHALTG